MVNAGRLTSHIRHGLCSSVPRRLLIGLILSLGMSGLQAQVAGSSDWVQYPPRVTPRQQVTVPADSKSEVVQYPPVQSISIGVKSAPAYRGGKQTYVVTFADGTTTTVTEKAVSEEVSWSADHLTKTTKYQFSDGSKHAESQTVEGVTRPPSYKGNKQTVVTDYGDGTSSKVVNTATNERQAWTDDHSVRIDTYTFADGSIHQDLVPVTLLSRVVTNKSGRQELKYTYSDGSIETKESAAIATQVTWSADHTTRHTKYRFQDGSFFNEAQKFDPVVQGQRYVDDKKIVVTQFGDGFIKEQAYPATSKQVSWSDDKRTKFTNYKFSDGTQHSQQVRVDAILVKTEFENDVELSTYKLGDGSIEVKPAKATTVREEWARDHVTKFTHYTFASGKTNTTKNTVEPTRSVVSFDKNLQYVSVRYGDGTVDSEVNKAESETVHWAQDHITKTTIFKFKDGTFSKSVESVLPTRLAPTYSQGEQVIVTQYADGHKTSEVNKPISQQVAWSKEQTQKRVTFTFPDGSEHVEELFVGVDGVLVSKELATKADGKAANPFVLKGIAFTGNTRFGSDELKDTVKDWVNQEVDMLSLKNAATLVSNKYKEAGLLAKVEIPQQEVKDGMVTLSIAEAKIASVSLRNKLIDSSVSAHAVDVVKANNPVGEFVDLKQLDKAALLLSEIPGVQAELTLKPAKDPKQTDAVIDLETSKKLEGSVVADNSGARSTGKDRLQASANFNGLAQRGDQIAIQTMHSEGSDFARLAYSEPVGPYGWRMGASASQMKYQVISSDLLALNAHGPASVRGLELVGPLLKDKQGSLSVQLSADDKRFHNETFSGVHSSYSAKVFVANAFGSVWDELGAGAMTTYSLAWSSGNFDLSGSPNQADDQASTKTAGIFNKYKLNLKREQKLSTSTTLSATYQSQWADKNLDASEKIFLGGPQGVRAYGTNEAGASLGKLLNLELQHQQQIQGAVLSQAAFYDAGRVTVNKFNDFSTALPLNTYTLKGAGLWAGVNMPNRLGMAYARLTWSRRIGLNPAANGLGLDQDGTMVRDRWWLTFSQSF
jgi:hemolysin activation/secretion protein